MTVATAVIAIGVLLPRAGRPAGRSLASSARSAIHRARVPHSCRHRCLHLRCWAPRLLVALVLAVVAGPTVALLVGFAVWMVGRRTAIARRTSQARRRRRELVEVAELLSIGLRNGHLPVTVCRSIPRRLDGEVAEALERTIRRHDRGSPFADALDRALAPLGPDAAALAALLASSTTDGAAVLDSLAEFVDERRAELHRDIEMVARRLPVLMLGPLVVCVLPAFLALTVVPVVLDSVMTLVA